MFDQKKEIQKNRSAIKPTWTDLSKIDTDRELKLERPKLFKEAQKDAVLVELIKDFSSIKQKTLSEVIASRRSLRKYSDTPLSFTEVSYLIHETARVTHVKNNVVFRTIPTGGATNAMETYIFMNRVDGIKKGLYHYLQGEDKLALIDDSEDLSVRVNESLLRQLRNASIVVFFTTVPYRSEYKYSFTAHKMIAMEAGHAGQNLSLAAEVVNSGAVCIAAYNQELLDKVLQVDGKEEFATYALCIGKRE